MSTSSSYPRSVQITVHLDAIAHNYQILKQRSGSKAFAVIKADAYGHGIDAVASYLSDKADGFAVVTVGEGVAVRDAGATQPVLVMMGRLGLSLESAETHLQNNQLRWQGVMSHLASADTPSNPLTTEQIARLFKLKNRFNLPFSLANSAGVLVWSEAQMDWSRVGVGMYGHDPVNKCQVSNDFLKPAMTVQAPIVSVKSLPEGHTVGYSETYRCPQPMTVAYAAVGYGDGLPRVLDDKATVLVQGVACPIIGRVSMDSIAIDCRPLNVLPTLGELITLWGPEHRIEQMAASAGTISYELMTGIRGRRMYTD